MTRQVLPEQGTTGKMLPLHGVLLTQPAVPLTLGGG